jgi:hypothetical protein
MESTTLTAAVGVQARNERLWRAGVRDQALCQALTNPGFSEVFSITEATLDNPNYRILGVSLMTGKLDWLLHRGHLAVTDCVMGNHDYAASDHKWLAADFRLCSSEVATSNAVAGSSPRLPALAEASVAAAAVQPSVRLPDLVPAALQADANAPDECHGLLQAARAEAGLLGSGH